MPPSEAQVQTFIGNAVRILDELREYAAVNTPNFIGTQDTLRGSVVSDMQDAERTLVAVENLRATLDGALRQGAGILDGGFREYARVLGLMPEQDIRAILERIFTHFANASKSVKTRAITYGSPAAGTNAGNGLMWRLLKDERNVDIEAIHIEDHTAECLRDEHSGAIEHEEVFEIRGDTPRKDSLIIGGSGIITLIKAISARDSLAFIGNPSFSEFAGTLTVPTDITNWTIFGTAGVNLGGNYRLDEGTFYRDFDGDSTPRSLLIRQDGTNRASIGIRQNFNVRRVQLNPRVPMYCQVAWRPAATGLAGNLVLRMGNVSATVALSTGSIAWNLLRIAIGQNNWFRQFNKEDPTIEIEVTGSAGTNTDIVRVDDVVLAPFVPHDNTWYAIVGGSTPFLRRDEFTWDDTIVTDSRIQQWLWRAFNFYLPHSATPTWVDPV